MSKLVTRQENERLCLVVESFEGENNFDLSVEEGDLVTVINAKRQDVWFVQDSDGNKGLVPSSCLKYLNETASIKSKNSPHNSNQTNNQPETSEVLKVFSSEPSIMQKSGNDLSSKRVNFEQKKPSISVEEFVSENSSATKAQFQIFSQVDKQALVETEDRNGKNQLKTVGLFDFSDEEGEGEKDAEILQKTSVLVENKRKDTCPCSSCKTVVGKSECIQIGTEYNICQNCYENFADEASNIDKRNNAKPLEKPRLQKPNVITKFEIKPEKPVKDLQDVSPKFWCPKCKTIVKTVEILRAECYCGFVFCTNCNQPYHGGFDCEMTEEARKVAVDQYLKIDINEKAEDVKEKNSFNRFKQMAKLPKKVLEKKKESGKAEEKYETKVVPMSAPTPVQRRIEKSRKKEEEKQENEIAKEAIESEKSQFQTQKEKELKKQNAKIVAEELKEMKEKEKLEKEAIAAEIAKLQAEAKKRQQEKKAQEKASERLIKKEYKKCPGCSAVIEKDEGCNHIKCKCGIEFCWLCLVALPPNNPYLHFNSTKCFLFRYDNIV